MFTNAQWARYLLIEVSDQLLALAMTNIASVQLIEDHSPGVASADPVHLPAIDLAQLVGKTGRSSRPAYAIILTASNSICAITVEAIRPVRTVSISDVLAVPPLLNQLPFAGVIRQPDALIPILDGPRLIALIRRLSPDLIMERPHAI